MALLFMDSFDHYVTADITEKWTTSAGTVAISAGNGRHASASMRCSAVGTLSFIAKGLSSSGGTAVLGVAIKPSSLGVTAHLAGLHDGGLNRDQVYVQSNVDGSIAVYRAASATGVNSQTAGTLLGTSAPAVLSAGVVAYLEVKVLLHASAGTVTVRLNGAVILSVTGVNTAGAGSTVWTMAFIGWAAVNNSSTIDFDDLYVVDGSGAAPWNDFLGDCRVDARYPTAAGSTTGWTPSAGANWQCVDDTAPNDDTDYTSAAAAALTDTFVVQDAPVAGAAIYGVQHCLSAKKTDAGSVSIAPVIRHSGVDYVGANVNPSTAYAVLQQINQTNPGTGAAWTEAGFNAAEFGYKRTV